MRTQRQLPRGRTAVALLTAISLALTLAACSPDRTLPAPADPQVYATLDVCSLVQIDDLDAEVRLTRSRAVPSPCRVETASGLSATVSTVSEVPEGATRRDSDGLTEEEADHGVALHLDAAPPAEGCRSYVIGDNGLRLKVDWALADPEDPASCEFIRTVASTLLGQIDGPLPTLDWPAGSLYRQDLCAVVDQSGLADLVGPQVEVTPGHADLRCTISSTDMAEGPPKRRLKVQATLTQSPHAFTSRTDEQVEVAGRRAVLRESAGKRCELLIDLGPNPVLSRLYGRDQAGHEQDPREALEMEFDVKDSYNCADLPHDVTGLVELLR